MQRLRAGRFLVLGDYHMIDAQLVDQALAYLIEHLPLQMHVVIATRSDSLLPLSPVTRARPVDEVRATDLRCTPAEAAAFLTQTMDLTLSAADIAAPEQRTEGWIAGLQFAALSLQRLEDPTGFIRSFTGSHQYVVDYLLEEILRRQPVQIQAFFRNPTRDAQGNDPPG